MTLLKVCLDLSKMLGKIRQSIGRYRFMDLVEIEEVAGGVLIALKEEVQHIKECM